MLPFASFSFLKDGYYYYYYYYFEPQVRYDSGEFKPVVGQSRPLGCVLSCTSPVHSPELFEVSLAGTDPSVPGSAVWSVLGTTGRHQGFGACVCISQVMGDLHRYVKATLPFYRNVLPIQAQSSPYLVFWSIVISLIGHMILVAMETILAGKYVLP